jgi:hypothetical protein
VFSVSLARLRTGLLKDVEEALSLHLVCYARNFESGGAKLETSENYARNTGFYLFNFLVTNAQYDEFWRIIGNLTERSGSKLDPLEEPLVRVVALLHQAGRSKPELNKLRNSLDYARRQLSANDKWYDSSIQRSVINALEGAIKIMMQRIRESR